MEKTIVNIAPAAAETPRTKRVAAYARVSCGKDTMLHAQLKICYGLGHNAWDIAYDGDELTDWLLSHKKTNN